MPAAYVPLTIDQGEDWAAQIIWTDDYDQPMGLTWPIKMEVRNSAGAAIITLEAPNPLPTDGSVPGIHFSDTGVIQLFIANAVTATVPEGEYSYDLFATTDDDSYIGTQTTRLIYGPVTVAKRTTVI